MPNSLEQKKPRIQPHIAPDPLLADAHISSKAASVASSCGWSHRSSTGTSVSGTKSGSCASAAGHAGGCWVSAAPAVGLPAGGGWWVMCGATAGCGAAPPHSEKGRWGCLRRAGGRVALRGYFVSWRTFLFSGAWTVALVALQESGLNAELRQ